MCGSTLTHHPHPNAMPCAAQPSPITLTLTPCHVRLTVSHSAARKATHVCPFGESLRYEDAREPRAAAWVLSSQVESSRSSRVEPSRVESSRIESNRATKRQVKSRQGKASSQGKPWAAACGARGEKIMSTRSFTDLLTYLLAYR